MFVVEVIFWLSLALVIYPYIIYPMILAGANRLSRLRSGRSHRMKPTASDSRQTNQVPRLTVIVSAYNEEAVIATKLKNTLSLDYPAASLDIIVISDGSTDRTGEIVEQFVQADARVHLLTLATQSGKTVGLNKAVPMATGEIIVFSDANAIFESDALQELIAPFNSPEVGYTVGSALYRDEASEAVNISEGLYWRYELWIKQLESEFHSVVGGDGAIYAIRRELYKELAPIDISDFVNPMQIAAAEYKGVFLPSARSFEAGTDEFADEFRRKRRIVNRSWGAVRRHFGIFSLARNARFLFMLISHKVIRWWSFAFVSVALLASAILSLNNVHGIYLLSFAIIGLSAMVAFAGWQMDRSGRAMHKGVYLLYFFYLVALASLLGIIDDFRGRTRTTWTHVR